MTNLEDRIRQTANRVGGIRALAKKSGVSERTIAHWLKGTEPKVNFLAAVAAAANVSLEWIITGAPPPRPDNPLTEDFAAIPRYDVDREQIIDYISLRRSWVRDKLLADPEKLAFITAVGDSMTPTIRDGDLLLLDTAVQSVTDDAIYAIAKQDVLVVKRVQTFFNGAVVIRSENPAYAEETLGPEETATIRIAGRVRWFGRRI